MDNRCEMCGKTTLAFCSKECNVLFQTIEKAHSMDQHPCCTNCGLYLGDMSFLNVQSHFAKCKITQTTKGNHL